MGKLSVITINRNDEKGLSKTIISVLSQNSDDFEYIIIDGASTDGSKELIEKLAISDKRLTYWCSEPDTGIYNAMNKAIKQAKGDYLLFLNSGDWFYDDLIIEDFINRRFTEDFVSGHLMLQYDFPVERRAITKSELGYAHLYRNAIMHQSTFIKRALFDQYGLYNENFKIVSDWEFFYKCLLIYNCTYIDFDRRISCFDLSGIGSQSNSERHKMEKQVVFDTYLPLVYRSYQILDDHFERCSLQEQEYLEYMNLKHGKLGFLIKWILKAKQLLK